VVERKKLVQRAAWIGLIGLAACLVMLVVLGVSLGSSQNREQATLEAHVAAVTKEHQAFLEDTALKIKGLPVDPKIIGDIQTRHYREIPGRWMYVWATNNDGQFLFGVPSDAFARLNTAYDQNQAVIKADNHYANRDQFLRTLLHHSQPIEVREKDERDERERGSRREPEWWRFHDELEVRNYDARRSNLYFLSTPIQDARGATVGNLNLKLADVKDQAIYSASRQSPWEAAWDMVGPFTAVILIWLWFLLPSWVYVDAAQRDMPRPLLWAVLTLIGSVFALMVYLLSRPTDVREFRCPQCSKVLNGSKAGCPYCGADLASVFCPQCQYPLKPEWSFCPSCRVSLKKPGVESMSGGTSPESTPRTPPPRGAE
jgi:double zinc ribbon protein